MPVGVGSRQRKNLSFAQKKCLSKAGKLMLETRMLRSGARIGVAVSGGMDSWVLLQVLRLHRRKLPFDVQLMLLHINPGFQPANHAPLVDWARKAGFALHVEVSDMGPRAHSAENRKNSPCFFCSWRRRKHLFQLVKKYELTHLALGHTADDLVQTFFLNLFYQGRVEGLYASEPFFQGQFDLIRPLLHVEKRLVQKAVREWNLPIWSNPCPSAEASKRSEVDEWLQSMWAGNAKMRKSVFSALKRWQQSTPVPSLGRCKEKSEEPEVPPTAGLV
ncbi:MAG: tRNA 2-thiocytidine biosynthesis TtcA family protein [Desulfovermiculus sp.]